ncbi:MAG: mannonate dehydratase [Rhizobiaceae bacterium]|nr:mannonate dehydratase [Rhizobiaceae bacterium]
MKQTWRWFGPADEISIDEIKFTGARGIVSALHHIAPGEVWPVDEIKRRQNEIETTNGITSGLTWDVAESLPVSEAIKSQSGDFKTHFDAYRVSLKNLAECGVTTVCYNFMPILDWTRTDLAYRLPHGGTAMLFDLLDFIVFDRFILARHGSKDDYSDDILLSAKERFETLDAASKDQLTNNIVAGLPGANDNWSLDDVKSQLANYDNISAKMLRQNLIDFLSEVVPTAEAVGIKLCCHPDDPPFPLLGLPRVMSKQSDYEYVLSAVNSPASGATFCTGSMGVAKDFDPLSFIKTLGPKIHFAHLRNTRRHGISDGDRYGFYESEHLDGDTDMVATIHALLAEEQRRKKEGRQDDEIFMRPDHGHSIASDLDRPVMPGYPLIGRLRGLAELRGIMAGYLGQKYI